MSEPAGGNHQLFSIIRSLLVFSLLVGVIVSSFWISFELGKRILGSASTSSVKSIPVKIPAVPPEIAGLQEEAVKQPSNSWGPKEPAILKKVTGLAQERQPKLVSSRYYKVQAGIFETKESAEYLVSTLKEKGIDNFIRKTVSGWRVQVGAYKTRGKAEELQSALKQKGFDTSIVIE